MGTKNCWEYWECPDYVREYCPAFKQDSGESGLLFTEALCPHKQSDYDYYPDPQQDRNEDRNADLIL